MIDPPSLNPDLSSKESQGNAAYIDMIKPTLSKSPQYSYRYLQNRLLTNAAASGISLAPKIKLSPFRKGQPTSSSAIINDRVQTVFSYCLLPVDQQSQMTWA